VWLRVRGIRVLLASLTSLGSLFAAAAFLASAPNPTTWGAAPAALQVSIASPAPGSTVSGEVGVTGQVSHAAPGTHVVLEVNGSSATVVRSVSRWRVRFDSKQYPNGTAKLTALAVEGSGKSSEVSLAVRVANTAGSTASGGRPTASPSATPTAKPTAGPTAAPIPSRAPSQSATGFVQADGTQLTLNGAPYRFEGMNVYNVASNGGCVPYLNPDTAMQEIGPGQNVFRFWAFQQFVVSNGQFDWAPFDQVLAAAAAHGERVIMDLTDEWNYCDGGVKTMSWYQSGYKDAVYPGDIVPYRQYVADVVARYKDNPNILMWELVNEAQAGGTGACPAEPGPFNALMSFGEDMGSLVKSIDPNHLLSFGIQDDSCGDWAAHYQALNAIPTIDVCTFHDYGYPTDPLGNPTPQNLQTAITMCHADNKPIFVGEIGIDPSTISPSTLQERADLFQAKFNAMTQAGVVGELLWDFAPEDQGGYEIGPQDPALSILGTY